ncbi:MAG: Tol biopolymer transport system, periplasmic component-related protein [Planctomycetota bacterium]|nr:Tol biopolymer transport system, periplasmic component-related protein [Planctomycetota bacterium]
MTKKACTLALTFAMGAMGLASAKEAKLTRYPHYHNGKVAFCYLGDIWTATEDGKNIQRMTVHKARDVYPRFSPDGKWIAFSSDRNGSLDVFVIPAEGGAVKELTTHSASEKVLGWSPDSKNVLFTSSRGEGFMPKLYTVPVTGGLARDAGPDMGIDGTFSPDGTKLAINRKGQSYWRKLYRGAYQTDVTVMDLAARTFKDLTEFDGLDSWPMWSQDGHVYFVSDREGKGLTNLWRVPESGGNAEKVTSFTTGDVRFPGMSADGKTIVFEHDFGVWKLDLASKQAAAIKFEIAAETQENLTEYRDFNSEVDDFDAAPNGKRIAFAVHGEIFTAPVDEGDLAQVTEGASKDYNVEYSPDGKLIAFVSDKTGREEIYTVPADGAGETKKVTDHDSLKPSYSWSPDSKKLAFVTLDGKLNTLNADGTDLKEIVVSKHGGLGGFAWSPDSKTIVYAKPDATQSSDVYLIPSGGGEEKKITFDSESERNPRFSADGKKVYFVRSGSSGDEGGGGFGGRGGGSALYVVYLEKQDKDPTEASANAPTGRGMPMFTPEMLAGAPQAPQPAAPKEVKIDWAGLKRRTLRITTGSVLNYVPAYDSRTIVFAGTEGGGGGAAAALGGGGGLGLYSIQDDGKRQVRIASGSTPSLADLADGVRGGRGFGGGFSNIKIARDGRTVFYQEGDGVYTTSITGGGGGGSPAVVTGGGGGGRGQGGGGGLAAALAAAGASGGGGGKKISFLAKVKIDKPAEWDEMFDDAWRTMKYRFYDPKMHGMDWDAARAKYKPLVGFVGDREELMNLINEMIGELNASHTGAAAVGNGTGRGRGSAGDAPGAQTGHLGMELVIDAGPGLYKVDHVYEDGPLDKDWVKLAKGNYILAFNGKPLKAGDDYFELINRRLNKKIELTVNDKPSTEGSWKLKVEPIAMPAYANLVYEKWVKDRRAIVEKQSNGRVGYLHIKAMDQPSLARFRKDLGENRTKEALVIDQRFNGGGNIEQELLAILVQRPYQVWHPRGSEPTQRPFAGYFGPKVVLQNWRSASNAEMFPAGFRALGLGKVIGTPTMGAVIGTNSYSLIDGSTVRTPGIGVFLADQGRTNMENTGVKPDILVENSPEDNLSGRDRQLEVGVQELLKQLPAQGGTVAEKK